MERIRRVCPGDEERLAYVQTESWKSAFREIVPAEILAECTELEPARAMYRRLLSEGFGNGYLLELDGKAHCIAWWSEARDEDDGRLRGADLYPTRFRKTGAGATAAQ